MPTTNNVTVQVQNLEMRDHAANAIFLTIAGRVEITDEEFQYHRNRLKALGLNRRLARCPFPWICKLYNLCRLLDCKVTEEMIQKQQTLNGIF
jgi:hypothetical protein